MKKYTIDELDDMISQWHDLPDDHPATEKPLWDFLGWTEEEYIRWFNTEEQPGE